MTANSRHVYLDSQRRYLVIDKVEFSPFSTTWLCYDREEKTWRCLEINVASESSGSSPEQLIRNTLLERGVDRDTARMHGVVLPYRTFWAHSPNGRHLVSVLPLLGPTLLQLKDMNHLDGDRRNAICQSMTRSLDYLHSQGIYHGNFHPGNVRVWMKEDAFDDYAPDEMWRVIGHRVGKSVVYRAGHSLSDHHSPTQMYEMLDWYRNNTPADMQDKLTTDVAIVDRGGAYLATDVSPASLSIPTHYQAPECIMRYAEMDTKTDIWALAASILYVVMEGDMFNAAEDDFELLKMIEELIGPMPESFWQAAADVFLEYCAQRWQREGQFKGLPRPAIPNAQNRRLHTLSHMVQSGDELEKRFKADGSYEDTIDHRLREPQALRSGKRWNGPFCGSWYLDPEEVACLGDLLRKMLRWDPSERWDAKTYRLYLGK
ncbi:kinase-like protein [Apiospora marii]|uniref:kinase-like protein n=1 Tax=Apiospora marii TaxID=335849 RepID=UPI00312D9BFE